MQRAIFCLWSGLPRRSCWNAENEQQERGALVAPFFTWRGCMTCFGHMTLLAAVLMSGYQTSEFLTRNIPPFLHPFNKDSLNTCPEPWRSRRCSIFYLIPTTSLRMMVVVQWWPLALPAIGVVQRNSIFRNTSYWTLALQFPQHLPLLCFTTPRGRISPRVIGTA